MAELADAIGVFVERYESEHVSLSAGKPSDVLKFLMKEHGLRQNDLPEIGTQGVVSDEFRAWIAIFLFFTRTTGNSATLPLSGARSLLKCVPRQRRAA